MNGKEFITEIADILDKEDIRTYDTNIIRRICELSQSELEKLIKTSVKYK